MAHRSTHQQLDERLEVVEKEMAELRQTLASVAGKLLAADAVAPDEPKKPEKARTAKKA